MVMCVRKLSYAGGAEITGLDLSKDLTAEEISAVRTAWLENLVLVFPGQEITMEQHVRFSRNFGELEIHPIKEYQGSSLPEIIEITNRVVNDKPSETGEVGRQWHSDGSYTTRPPTGSFLHCRALPDVGGNTWFSNMYMAYEALSPKMKELIADLEVVNDLGLYFQQTRTAREDSKVAANRRDNPPVVQSLIRVHPETGRKALYVNEACSREILGMSVEESAAILQFLFRHSVRPEFTYRHVWSLFDIVLWDNRCLIHIAPKDYDYDQVRHMCRTTLTGEPCGRLLEAAVSF